MSDRRDIWGQLLRHGPLAAIAGLLVWHSLQYNFVTDDAFISFVYSRRLAEDGALVFNPGDPVEGYTNFLWTFLLGILMKVGLAPEIMSRVLGTGFAIATLYVAFRTVELCTRRGSPAAYLAPLLLALASGYACWSSGGLETQMFTFFVAAALWEYGRADGDHKHFRRVGVYLALAAMTRPEGMLVAGLLGVHRLAINLARDRRWKPTNDELICIGSFVALWGPYFLWRLWYYGHPFPNTYYVKAAGEVQFRGDFQAAMWANGWHYVKQWVSQTGVTWVAPLIVAGLAVARPRSARFVYGTAALLVGAVYLVYTARVGGDFMGLHRFIMPVFVIAAVGVALAVAAGAELVPRRGAIAAAAAGLLIAIPFGLEQYRLTHESLRWGNWASDRGIDTPAFLWLYSRDRAAVGKHMEPCFRDTDFAVFGGVGAQPYYSDVRGIDGFGLVSWDVAHCQPRVNPRAGHTKWASSELMLKQPRRDGHSCPPELPGVGRYDWSAVDGGPPTFWFAGYALHDDPNRPRNWAGRKPNRKEYRQVTLHIGCTDDRHTGHPPGWTPATPEPLQFGPYYSFFVHESRYDDFARTCKGIVE